MKETRSMEGVVQALQRVHEDNARNAGKGASQARVTEPAPAPGPATGRGTAHEIGIGAPQKLSRQLMFEHKIFSFDSNREQTRSYDMLRNLVLDDLVNTGSRTIAMTAPTYGCGTTVSATNLAFSLSRLHTTKVLLLDCKDSPSGGVADAIGAPRLFHNSGDGEQDAPIHTVQADGVELYVAALQELKKLAGAQDQSGAAALARLKAQLGPVTIVLDLPPMLVGDQTLPLILGADAVILVLAVGRSTVADFEACKTYLSETSKVHVLLNKARSHGL